MPLWQSRFSDNMTLSLECFDILNQRKLINEFVSGGSRQEYQTNGIRRYGMLRFVCRLNSSKNREIEERDYRMSADF